MLGRVLREMEMSDESGKSDPPEEPVFVDASAARRMFEETQRVSRLLLALKSGDFHIKRIKLNGVEVVALGKAEVRVESGFRYETFVLLAVVATESLITSFEFQHVVIPAMVSSEVELVGGPDEGDRD